MLKDHSLVETVRGLRFQRRFWRKVRKGESCWEWTAAKTADGYGVIGVGHSARLKAPRVSWMIAHGAIPDDLCVLHRCDNPACVYLPHLFLGTRTENSADKVAKGRQRNGVSLGENHGRARLTSANVLLARTLRSSGLSFTAIARRLAVSRQAIASAVRGETWRHVEA